MEDYQVTELVEALNGIRRALDEISEMIQGLPEALAEVLREE